MHGVGVLAGAVNGFLQEEVEHGWARSPLEQGQVQWEMAAGVALADDLGGAARRLKEPLDDGIRGATPKIRRNKIIKLDSSTAEKKCAG